MTKRTITIRFSSDKNGKRRAHYWGAAMRWLPISIVEAELKLATDPRYQLQSELSTIVAASLKWDGQTARQRVGGTFGS